MGPTLGGAPWLYALVLCPATACSANARDVVPSSRDVVAEASGVPRSTEGYEYVARRPRAVVALAEARGVPANVASAAIERLADALDTCVQDRSDGGPPPHGAARVIAQIASDGSVSGTSVRVEPGSGATQTAVVCLVAPTRLLLFPPADGDRRGVAIEALWGQVAP